MIRCMPLQGMPGPYRGMEDYTGDFKERWAGGMYAAPTGEGYTEIPQLYCRVERLC